MESEGVGPEADAGGVREGGSGGLVEIDALDVVHLEGNRRRRSGLHLQFRAREADFRLVLEEEGHGLACQGLDPQTLGGAGGNRGAQKEDQ